MLLKISGLAKSTYYYNLKTVNNDDKNKEIMETIKDIFTSSRKCYGYRRVTSVLNNNGIRINHKKVLRLMKKLGICPKGKKVRKYNSYKGTVGKIAPNVIDRAFKAEEPNLKWYTDITEFKTGEGKVYLSPILDGFNSEIISYSLSLSPNMKQIKEMLSIAFKNKKDLEKLVLHSDQGWQYQQYFYQKELKDRKITQSMSRKATCLDNSLMENFFGRLKVEMYYGSEKLFKTTTELIKAIDDYIDFYNNDRIKLKLNGLSPVDYRKQSV
jgi:putative transposase